MPTWITSSERYFISKYRAATLRGAVERAAVQERHLQEEQTTLIGLSFAPINVEAIARKRRITLTDDAQGVECQEASLLPTKDGFLVRLRPHTSESRRRLSLAHEVGHTLFYRDAGLGPRHQVDLVEAREILAEESICNMFAAALLMPWECIKQGFQTLLEPSPQSVLQHLEQTARRLKVSIPALLQRVGHVRPEAPPFLALYWRFKRQGSGTARLAVESCTAIGFDQKVCVWRNRSPEGVNLRVVSRLFDAWCRWTNDSSDPRTGCFTLDERGDLVRTSIAHPAATHERLNVSVHRSGRWQATSLPARVSSWLYARPGTTELEVYIISVAWPEA
jgi:hypothetical protein